MTVTVTDASAAYIGVTLNTPAGTGISAKYAIPSSQTLQIDLTDLVRAYPSGMVMVYEMNAAGATISTDTKSWTTSGRINPVDFYKLSPKNDTAETEELTVTPPSVMLKPLNNNTSVIFEMANGGGGYYFSTGRIKFPPLTNDPIGFANAVTIPSGAESVELWHLSDNVIQAIPLKALECGKRYAAVRWVSFTGQTRQHTFEIAKVTTESGDVLDVETITNEYDQRKNRVDGFALRLSDLDRYDLWYYSDIVNSSDVRVSLDGVNFYQVQVLTKKQTQPDGDAGGFNTLEISVNYRKYDTL